MKPSPLLPVALLSLALAGCVTPPAHVETASAGNATAASAPAPAQAAAPASSAEGASPATPRVQSFTFDGLTPAYEETCAFVVLVGQCADVPPTADFSKVRAEPKLNGTPKQVHLTITWTAASPAEQTMTAFVGTRIGDDYSTGFGKVGSSPLTLDVPDLQAKSNAQLYIGLIGPWEGEYPGPAGASASANPMDQPWKLNATVTLS
jgi:hypothetical protein